jgi:hypothetical protein
MRRYSDSLRTRRPGVRSPVVARDVSCTRPDRPCGSPSLSLMGAGDLRPGGSVTHPTLSRAEVKERVKLYLLVPCAITCTSQRNVRFIFFCGAATQRQLWHPHASGFEIAQWRTSQNSSRRMISSSQRLGNTQHSQETDLHGPGGIRNHNSSKRGAADLRLQRADTRTCTFSFTCR